MTYTPRQMDIRALDGLARHLVVEFRKNSVRSLGNNPLIKFVGGRGYVLENLYNLYYLDEFNYVLSVMKDAMEPGELNDFRRAAAGVFEKRDPVTTEEILAERLAINPAGEHIPGRVGSVKLGDRVIGKYLKEVPRYSRAKRRSMIERFTFVNGTFANRMTFSKWADPELIEIRLIPKNLYWHVYAGEMEEREFGNVNSRVGDGGPGSNGVDPLPEGARPFSLFGDEVFALTPIMSNECAILACDAIVDNLDEGSTGAEISGRSDSASRAADPDTAVTGVELFNLVMQTTAFAAAGDGTGKATASRTASIADDTSATAGTLLYCRVSAAGTGADDHLDGSAGTSGANFNFNTLTIGSGSTVSMSTFDVSVNEAG